MAVTKTGQWSALSILHRHNYRSFGLLTKNVHKKNLVNFSLIYKQSITRLTELITRQNRLSEFSHSVMNFWRIEEWTHRLGSRSRNGVFEAVLTPMRLHCHYQNNPDSITSHLVEAEGCLAVEKDMTWMVGWFDYFRGFHYNIPVSLKICLEDNRSHTNW